MLLDYNNNFEDGSTRSILAPTFGQHCLDISAVRDVGAGKRLAVDFTVTTAFAIATVGATVEFQVRSTPYSGTGHVTGTVSAANTGDVITWADHGLQPGDPVIFTTIGSSGLTASIIYYVTKTTFTSSTFTVASSLANALAASPTLVAVTGDQAGITAQGFPTGLNFISTSTDTGDTFSQPADYALVDGDAVQVLSLTTSTLGGTGGAINTTLFVCNATTSTFQLAATRAGALAGTATVTVTTDGSVVIGVLPVILGSSGAIPKEFLGTGAQVPVYINPAMRPGITAAAFERPLFPYAHVYISPSAVATAGKVAADVVLDADSRRYHASGYTF